MNTISKETKMNEYPYSIKPLFSALHILISISTWGTMITRNILYSYGLNSSTSWIDPVKYSSQTRIVTNIRKSNSDVRIMYSKRTGLASYSTFDPLAVLSPNLLAVLPICKYGGWLWRSWVSFASLARMNRWILRHQLLMVWNLSLSQSNADIVPSQDICCSCAAMRNGVYSIIGVYSLKNHTTKITATYIICDNILISTTATTKRSSLPLFCTTTFFSPLTTTLQ